ncbi:hypothetical protein JYK14_18765 [Siccirubricoccus sp. KC 17139]|uniref:Uncharacterized protein n=1 Tax=Siccirubricoccus soli TaxID=2899147 RepID=A0ABT1D8C3_9PROT|nr:hypothetical protein [Siccirubricoccus soli]MCO6418190.1 hypothetical protein [Siccirubricoccus soli]MCP2684325.1 hypothetical protein [Siccirubricoccus soli]
MERLWRRSPFGSPGLDREEAPWALLLASAACAPLAVLAQGGDGHTAILAGLACLAAPALAIEMMLGMARLGFALVPTDRR